MTRRQVFVTLFVGLMVGLFAIAPKSCTADHAKRVVLFIIDGLHCQARQQLGLGNTQPLARQGASLMRARLDRNNLLIYRDDDGQLRPVESIADWQKRRTMVLAGMQEVMGQLPGKEKCCPLDVKVVEEEDCGSYVRRLITYTSEPGGRVPAYLLIPKKTVAGKEKAPAVLCLHPTDNQIGHKTVVGLGSQPNCQYARELAERGYVALAPSYPLLANYQPDLDKLGYQSGTMKAIWDNICGIDLLESLPFVKPGGVGAIGHSLGGHNAVYTAVFDERIKVVVTSCGLDSYIDYMDGNIKGWTSNRYMPKLLDYRDRLAEIPFDFHEMIGALAPRYCFISAPLRDSNFKWDSVDRIVKAALQTYQLYGVPERLRVEHPDCDHDFPDVIRQMAYRVFDSVLAFERTNVLGRPQEEPAILDVPPSRDRVTKVAGPRKLIAQTYNSGFELAHDTYNGLSSASDGKIYYVLSTESYEVGAQMYVFDPSRRQIKHLGDITEACGEKGLKAIPQGKSHVNFVESNGKLYFATHVGYYSIVDGMEKIGIPPQDFKPYPGGHFLAYDMESGKFEDLAKAPHGEGILSMTMDTRRGRLYGLTWPTGYFIRYDLATKDLKDFGPTSKQGENGKGENYRTLCRSLVVNPQDGSVYFTTGDGAILRYRYDSIEVVEGEDMKKDYFGLYDPTSPGHMGYNWRQTVWYDPERAIYGVHGNSGYLFRFDPQIPRVDVLERITSLPSKQSGMYDQFSYGYLGFTIGPDGHTLYYLTGGPVYVDGKRVVGKSKTAMGESKGIENLHLITYDIPTGKYIDHGPIFFNNGQRLAYVNSIAVGKDGTVYTLSRITENGRTRTDLVAIPGSFSSK